MDTKNIPTTYPSTQPMRNNFLDTITAAWFGSVCEKGRGNGSESTSEVGQSTVLRGPFIIVTTMFACKNSRHYYIITIHCSPLGVHAVGMHLASTLCCSVLYGLSGSPVQGVAIWLAGMGLCDSSSSGAVPCLVLSDFLA